MMNRCQLSLSLKDSVDGKDLPMEAVRQVSIEPPALAVSLAGELRFDLQLHRSYRIELLLRRGLYLPVSPLELQTDRPLIEKEIRVPRRSKILYITIDELRDMGHEPNLNGLAQAVAQSGRPLDIEQLWWGDVQDLSAQALEQLYRPFMLFIAGSYTEWHRYALSPPWAQILDSLGAVLRSSDIPTLAVCGGHQLVARSFGQDWNAVGHLVPDGIEPLRIAHEIGQIPVTPRYPAPRISERGTYPLIATPAARHDFLFARGLSDRILFFTESHADQVCPDALSPDFEPILEPARTEAALALPSAPLSPHNRCAIQALHYKGPQDRVLYTVQFHPELRTHPGFESQALSPALRSAALQLGSDGQALLLNFFDIAQAFWLRRAVTKELPTLGEVLTEEPVNKVTIG